LIAGGDDANVCATSAPLWNSLVQCVCQTGCVDVCGDNACAGGAVSDPCFACVQTTCGGSYNACGADG
jgi:hypothetical protein